MAINIKQNLRKRRRARIRSKINGTSLKPRLSVFRSNTNIYAQLIDDTAGITLVACDDRKIDKTNHKELKAKTAKAYEVGTNIAKLANEKKINQIVFDRGGYRFHGRVKALAEGARAGGLKF